MTTGISCQLSTFMKILYYFLGRLLQAYKFDKCVLKERANYANERASQDSIQYLIDNRAKNVISW